MNNYNFLLRIISRNYAKLQIDKNYRWAIVKNSVSPIINSMLTDIVLHRPKDVVGFCQKWLKEYHARSNSKHDSDSGDEANLVSSQKPKNSKPRKAISAEVYGQHHRALEVKPPVHKKSEESKTRILLRLKDSFLFRGLDDQETNSIIDSMPELTVEANTIVMKQGDEACTLYVVDRGQLQSFSAESKQPHPVRHFFPGDSFGELSLLYPQCRSYSVKSLKPSTLYVLDRSIYSAVSLSAANNKRQTVDAGLKSLEIFQKLDKDQRNQLADLAQDVCLYTNEALVKQKGVYIVQRGRLLEREIEDNEVGDYQEAACFTVGVLGGEREQNSIVATTLTKSLFLDKQAIERVIGPLQRVLRRNTPIHKSI